MKGVRRRFAMALTGTLALTLAPWPLNETPLATAPAAATPACSSFDAPLRDRLNPSTRAQLLTANTVTDQRFAAGGFTANRGTIASAAQSSRPGLSPVRRLYRSSSKDYFYTLDRAELVRATSLGYRDQGTAFFASRTGGGCLIPMFGYVRSGVHRFSTLPGERRLLSDTGWRAEGIRFYVGPAATDPAFTLGVLPDTQQEVLRGSDRRFLNRTQWLVGHRRSIDLRYALHTGDVVNWDTPDHVQFQRAAAALQPLTTAGVPYSLSLGNHDTAAVCRGGSACNTSATKTLVRQTTVFNRYLSSGTGRLQGRFETGKVDNTFSTFEAGGAHWLVLNLELWPRVEAVRWAQRVVAAHPRHNVVIATHSYLTADGRIYGRREYGAVSPQYLFDHLVRVYPNVRMVLSGHVGKAAARVDRGRHGNRIVSLMLTVHDNRTNPLRLVEVNTTAGTLNTWVYAPYTNTKYPVLSKAYAGLRWIR